MKNTMYVIYVLTPLYRDYSFHFSEYDSYYRSNAVDFEWTPFCTFFSYKSMIKYLSNNMIILDNLSSDMRETSSEYIDSEYSYKKLYYILKFIKNKCFEVNIYHIKQDSDVLKYKYSKYAWSWYNYSKIRNSYEFRREPVPCIRNRIIRHSRFGKSKGLGYRQLLRVQTDPDYKEFKSGKLLYRSYIFRYRHKDRCWKSQYRVKKQYLIHVR